MIISRNALSVIQRHTYISMGFVRIVTTMKKPKRELRKKSGKRIRNINKVTFHTCDPYFSNDKFNMLGLGDLGKL